MLGDYKDALYYYQQCLETCTQTERPNILYKIALCQIKLGDVLGAVRSLETALHSSNDTKLTNLIHYRLSICCSKLGRFQEALNELRVVWQKGVVEEDEMLYQMGVTLMRNGDWNEGRNHLNRLVKNFPNSSLIKDAKLRSQLNSFGVLAAIVDNQKQAAEVGKAHGLKNVAIDGQYFLIRNQIHSYQEALRIAESMKQVGLRSEILP